MSRQRTVNEKAVNKTLAFLQDLKIKCDGYGFENVSTTDLQEGHFISKSTYSICKKLNFIGTKGQWLIGNPTREAALQILEVLRKQSDKRYNTVISPEFVTAIERLTNSMNTLSLQNEKSLKSPLLSRALNQVEQSHGNHLFRQIENDEAKLFELVKTISGNCIDRDVVNGYPDYALSELITKIIGTSKTILSQLKH